MLLMCDFGNLQLAKSGLIAQLFSNAGRAILLLNCHGYSCHKGEDRDSGQGVHEMLWKGRRESQNVEDQRDGSGSSGGIGRGGFRLPGAGSGMRSASGGGISGIVILVVLFFALKACGIDPMQVLTGPDAGGALTENQTSSEPRTKARSDEMGSFVKVIMAETEDTWSGVFQTIGEDYPEPKLVIFDGQVRSACGFASAASGPFYCPGDQKVYIDLAFYDQLARQFGPLIAELLEDRTRRQRQVDAGILPDFLDSTRAIREGN